MTWLLCDYGEVLCMPPTPGELAALAATASWDPGRGDFTQAYWVERVAYDRADLSAGEYWSRVLGHPVDEGQLRQIADADAAMWIHPNDETLAAVERAGRRGLRLAILSNAPIEVAEAIDQVEWVASFSHRIFSCYLRATKPDRAAYEKTLSILGARPDEVVFFDDRPVNVAAAIELGIDGRMWTHPAQIDEVTKSG